MPEEGTKYDWFKNELVGNTSNFADIYQNGFMPEQFGIKESGEYWDDEVTRKPFEDKFGAEEGRVQFEKVYKNSSERLEAYRKGRFDISTTSTKRMLPTQYGRRLAALGLAKLYNSPNISISDVPRDLEGRDIVAGIYSRPEYSKRQGAFDNGVLINGEIVDYDSYRGQDNDSPLVYAVNKDGSYKLNNGKNYLRPLAEGEERQAHEEYATKFSDYMGFNGLDTPDWYAAKFLPKNAANFVADVLDSGAEVLKSVERVMLDEDEDPSDTYDALSDFQNIIGQYLHGSTSDTGRQDWTSPEGLIDGITQVAFQLGGMYGVAATTGGLLRATKMASEAGASRAASVMSRMFMSTLAADGIEEQAAAAGLSQRERGTLHALTLLGYYKISKLSEWVIGTSPALQKITLNSLIKKNLVQTVKAVSKGTKLTPKGIGQIAKNIVRDLDGAVRATISNPNALARFVSAGSLESLEEVSESVMELGIKETYDRMYKPLVGATAVGKFMGTDEDSRFNTDYSTLASELAQAATLGFVGGGMVSGVTSAKRFFRGQKDGEELNFYKYIASKQSASVKKNIELNYQKGGLGDAGLNAEGLPVKEGEDSRNDIAYKAIMHDFAAAEAVWNSKGLNSIFENNEQKLAFIKGGKLSDSQIGRDVAEQLKDIDKKNRQIAEIGADPSPENIKKIEGYKAAIKKATVEIDAIRDGKRVTKYLQQALYRLNNPITDFNDLYALNESAKKTSNSRISLVEKVEDAAKKATIDNFEDYKVMSEETGDQIIKQLDDKYPMEEGGRGEKYDDAVQLIDEAVERSKVIHSPELEILSNFDISFKPTYTFDTIYKSEKDKMEDFEEKGTSIYDDTKSLSTIINNVIARIDQLDTTFNNNPEVNEAHLKLEEKADEVIISKDTYTSLRKELTDTRKKFGGLHQIALANKSNFGNAIQKANDASINEHGRRLNDAIEVLEQVPVFGEELGSLVATNMVSLANSQSIEEKQQIIIKTQKIIYDYFSGNPQAILDILYKNAEIVSDKSIGQRTAFYNKALGVSTEGLIIPNTLRYLKQIIVSDPEIFLKHYETIVNSIPEEEGTDLAYTHSRNILSPAQRNIAQQVVGFLNDTTIKANADFNNVGNTIEILHGIFLSGFQGSGKTLTGAVAAVASQKQRGGKILVVANDSANAKNVADTVKGLGGKVDESLSGSVTFERLMSHLNGNTQGDISTIIYDEATLLGADQLYKLDLALREINSKREHTPIGVIYMGDKGQIGSTRNGVPYNIASSGTAIEATDELVFSYRTGNDQINNTLDHIRKIISPKNEGVIFTSFYDIKGDTLSGARSEDSDFETAFTTVFTKLTANDNYMIIADEDRHGEIKNKHDIPESKILTPEQAQGKQWDYVIVDIDTEKVDANKQDKVKVTRLLSSVGRSKKFVLFRISNNAIEGVSRNMYSEEGVSTFVDTAINEEQRLDNKKAELSMLSGLTLSSIAENTSTGSHESISFKNTTSVEVVEDIKKTPLKVEQKSAIDAIINKIDEYPSKFGVPSNEAYVLSHQFYSYAESYTDGDVSKPTSITDIGEILRLKKNLLSPQSSVEPDVTFSLEIHANEKPTRIITHATEYEDDNKRFVIYATIHEGGVPVTKISMGAMNDPSAFGLNQSDLFNVEIPFTAAQNTRYLQSIRNSVADVKLSPEEQENSIFLKPSTFKARDFSMKGEETPLSEFVDTNGNFYNFGTKLIYPTKLDPKTDRGAEKQPYLLYSFSLSPQELDTVAAEDQDLIDDPTNDIRKIAVNGGKSLTVEDALDRIWTYQNSEKTIDDLELLPSIPPGRKDALMQYLFDTLKLGKYNPKVHADRDVKALLYEKQKKASLTVTQKTLIDAFIKTSLYGEAKYYGKKYQDLEKPRFKQTGKKRTLKNKKTGKKFTIAGKAEVTPGTIHESMRFSVNRIMHYLNVGKKQNNNKTSAKVLNKVTGILFPNGVYTAIEAIQDSTLDRKLDEWVLSSADFSYYHVKNMLHPPMPVHNIKFDFFKDVLSNDSKLKTTISTTTKFVSSESVANAKVEDVKIKEGPVTIKNLLVKMPVTEGNESTGDYAKFLADVNDTSTKSSMYDIFNLYFNEKPNTHKFEEFTHYFKSAIYNKLHNLTGDIPHIVENDTLDSTLKEFRKELRVKGKIIDDTIKEIIALKGTVDLNRKMLLSVDGNAELYYDYIMGKEFDSLLKLNYSNINTDGNTYNFEIKQWKENQLIDNKDKISHIERGNSMLKMHIFNMPILSRNRITKQLTVSRMADVRALAKITRAIRDNNISDTDKARDFFSRNKNNPELYSFYMRFLNPEPYRVKMGKGESFRTNHSIASLNNDISEDIITGMLSFIASGNEAELTKVDLQDDDIKARFTTIESNRFRDDIELGIMAVSDNKGISIDDKGNVNIRFGTNADHVWKIAPNGAITGNKGFLGRVLNKVGIAGVNAKQYADLESIKTISGTPLTGVILYRIGKYLSTPKVDAEGNIRAKLFNNPGAELNEWLIWTDEYQNIKAVDGAFGYTNISGDRINLLSLSYPLTRTNQKIKNLASTTGPLRNNALIKGELKIDSYLLKEGFEADRAKRTNGQMTETEQMLYDFKYLYLRSLLKGRDANSQSVIFNPMTYADKSSAVAVRMSGQFLPTYKGKIDIAFLKKRTEESISNYNAGIGQSIIEQYIDAFDIIGKKNHGISVSTDPNTIHDTLLEINDIVKKLSKKNRNNLLSTGLVQNLMYTRSGNEFTGGINEEFISNVRIKGVSSSLSTAKSLFSAQYKESDIKLTNDDIQRFKDRKYEIDEKSLLDSYFYNHAFVAHNFSTFHVGSVFQYKSADAFGDQIKRNSQITTNRQMFVLRRDNPETIKQGRKLGKFSKTAIVSDVSELLRSINYQGDHFQEIFDGAAFHNLYATLQMKESYGNELGFNVSSTLKPISSHVNELTGHSRFDKYASFSISPDMIENGEPFIKKVHELMLSSVEFDTDQILDLDDTEIISGVQIDEVSDGVTTGSITTKKVPANLLELENAVKLKLGPDMSYEEIVARTLDIMVKNDLQDDYLQEVIFDSSVKTGVSNLNRINTLDDIQNFGRLNYIERNNEERGLILDASHDPNDSDGAFPTQVVSAVMQGNFSNEEANNILAAIYKIGEIRRTNLSSPTTVRDYTRDLLRNRINKRGDIGLVHRIVNGQHDFSFDNKTVHGQLFSSLASQLSDDTIRLKIKGGQQVVGASYGVFNHPIENRPLRGFDAFNAKGISIKDSQEWLDLVHAVDAGKYEEAKIYRAAIHDLMVSEFTTVQQPEVIIAPTMFADFDIPAGTKLSEIELGFSTGNYKGTYEDFKKTLDIVMVRIPATSKQSYMGAEVVGFAEGVDNTFYTNLDLLYFQGADQDIDKGNVLSYEMDGKGQIIIPENLDGVTDEIHIKNFIVNQIVKSSGKSSTLLESTMPTSITTLKSLAEPYLKEEDRLIHYLNPFSQSTMFVRGQAGKRNISIHASGIKTYSSLYHSYNKRNNSLDTYTAKSAELDNRVQRIEGIKGNPLAYFETLDFYSELINAAVDNAKDPILGALGINETTGNLVNTLAFLGYSPKQVIDFLHNKDVETVIKAYQKHTEFTTDRTSAIKTFEEFVKTSLENNPNSVSLQDMDHFITVGEDFAILSRVLGINKEVPNTPYKMYSYMASINEYLKDITNIHEFIAASDTRQEELIQEIDRKLINTKAKTINILQVIKDNEHITSFIKSAILVDNTMKEESKIYNIVGKVVNRIADVQDRPAKESIYKDSSNFIYGLAIDDYLSLGGGTTMTLSMDGITQIYNLGLVEAAGGQLGRIEFMRDFPQYFMSLTPARMHTLKNYMVVESVGKDKNAVNILKLEGDFRAQSAERKVSLMSMMDMLEKGDGRSSIPDMGIPNDSSVKEMLFNYALIKDKGGNTGTSYTALFDPEDFKEFDSHLQNVWQSAYEDTDIDDLIKEVAAISNSFNSTIKKSMGLDKEILKAYRFSIPYKNDKTLNDVSDLSKSTVAPTIRKVTTNNDLERFIEERIQFIITTKSSNTINGLLTDGGYNLISEENGENTWELDPTITPVVKSKGIIDPFSKTISTQDYDAIELNEYMDAEDDADDSPTNYDIPPWEVKSKKDFEEKEKRKFYASNTNHKTLSSIVNIINSNSGSSVVAMTQAEIRRTYGNNYSMLRGFVRDGVPVINTNLAGLDTPIHEMGHLWISALRSSNPELYSRIISEASKHEMMNRVASQYPELEGEALAEEVFSTIYGLSQKDKSLSAYNKSFMTKMKDTLMDFIRWLDDMLYDVFGTKINTDDTMIDIMNKLGDRMLSSSVFNFTTMDIQTLSNMGVVASPLSTELRALQENLVKKGLMETVC